MSEAAESMSYGLLELADASERGAVLLRVGDAAVAAVPPQLVAQVLDTVGLGLRTHFPLSRERERAREDDDVVSISSLCW